MQNGRFLLGKILCLAGLVLFLSSCERKLEPPKEMPTGRAFGDREKHDYLDTMYDGANLLLTLHDTEFRTVLELRRSQREYAFNLNSLPKTFRFRREIDLRWVNAKFASFVSSWDGAFASRLYLPLDSAGEIQHFEDYSIADDSVGSNAFIVESGEWAPIGHIYIHNLITLKIDSLSFARDSTLYPFLRDLNSDGKSLIVETRQGIFRKNIQHLSRNPE